MRRSLLAVPAAVLSALLLPAAAQAVGSTVTDPVGDAPSGHDITAAYYATGTSAVGMSVKVRNLASTGRIRLMVSPLDDQADQFDVVRYRGRVYDVCYHIDYSRSGKPVQQSCAGKVDHFSYDLKTGRVAIVAKYEPGYFSSYGPYKLQATAIRSTGQVLDTVKSRTLQP